MSSYTDLGFRGLRSSPVVLFLTGRKSGPSKSCPCPQISLYSILKFFQVDITGIVRMTSYARYFKEEVGSRRPNWRWLMCFLELPKANTSCKAFVKRLSLSWGSSDDTKSSMTSTRHSTCTLARRLPTV